MTTTMGRGRDHVFEITIDNSFDFTSGEYAELFARSCATAFQHPVWLSGLYDTLVEENSAQPLIIVVRSSEGGKLAMVLPLVRHRYAALRVIEFADLRVTDYVSPITDPKTFTRILEDPRAGQEVRRLLRPYDVLRVNKLSDRALPLERLFAVEKRQSMGMNAYASPLEPTFADWRERRLDRSYSKELDKKSRQLARRGTVRFTIAEDTNGVNAAFEALKTYRGKRFDGSDGERDLLQTPTYFDFYRGVAMRGLGNFARTYALWVDDQIVASALGLGHNGSRLVILSGFDQDHFRKQSVGSLLFEQIARDCIERGEKILDFTIGDEPYKLTFGAEPSPMWRISRAGSPLGFAAALAVEKMPSVKALARRLLQGTGGSGETSRPQQTATHSAEASAES